MAYFPQGYSSIERRCANTGERAVLHQLRRCLPDDHTVWHDVPVGPQARQPDFVVLSPRQGILILEVKHWKLSSMGQVTRDSVELDTPRGRVTEAHPLRQARDYAMELVDLMARDPGLVHGAGPFQGKLLFPYGWGAVLSGITAAQVAGQGFETLFPPHQVLLRDALAEDLPPAEFQNRLWGMFTVHYPHTLSLPQRDRVRWHLFPEIRVTQASLWDAPQADDTAVPMLPMPDLMQVMDLQQEQVARSLGEGHRVVHGVAGSGKTLILVFRAQQLAAAARPDQPILVLCFNRTLAQRIEHQLRQRGVDDRVVVRTFHAWCQDLVRTYELSVPPGLKGDAYFEALTDTVSQAIDRGLVPSGQYMALLVDEAHDFEAAWLRMAVRMVSPSTQSLLVMYDDTQSIYKRRRPRFTLASVGIQAQGRTTVLRLNYRNTAEVLALAMHCAGRLLEAADARPPRQTDPDESAVGADAAVPQVLPSSAGRRGGMPRLVQCANARDEADWIAAEVAAHLDAGGSPDDIAVLARVRMRLEPVAVALRRRRIPVQSMSSPDFKAFSWRRPAVRLLTLHSAKGLEFPVVCVSALDTLPMRGESLDEELRLLYVGMTRASQALWLTATGDSVVVQRVRNSLEDVGRQFPA